LNRYTFTAYYILFQSFVIRVPVMESWSTNTVTLSWYHTKRLVFTIICIRFVFRSVDLIIKRHAVHNMYLYGFKMQPVAKEQYGVQHRTAHILPALIVYAKKPTYITVQNLRTWRYTYTTLNLKRQYLSTIVRVQYPCHVFSNSSK